MCINIINQLHSSQGAFEHFHQTLKAVNGLPWRLAAREVVQESTGWSLGWKCYRAGKLTRQKLEILQGKVEKSFLTGLRFTSLVQATLCLSFFLGLRHHFRQSTAVLLCGTALLRFDQFHFNSRVKNIYKTVPRKPFKSISLPWVGWAWSPKCEAAWRWVVASLKNSMKTMRSIARTWENTLNWSSYLTASHPCFRIPCDSDSTPDQARQRCRGCWAYQTLFFYCISEEEEEEEVGVRSPLHAGQWHCRAVCTQLGLPLPPSEEVWF